MIRLTYASTTNQEWSPEELLGLLKQSRTNNGAKNITGILLYSNGTFFQVLEGDEATVENLYTTIEKDPRHKNCTLIEKLNITERAFPYWSMGFEKIEPKELRKMEGLNNFFEHDFTPAGFASHKNIIGPLLTHLRSKLVKQVSIESHEELPTEHDDPFIKYLHRTIRIGVKFLSILMVAVILLSIVDVLYVIWVKVSNSPHYLMTTNDLLETFGSFLAVLIAIEIFLNITIYIRSDVIPVKLVVATALMAISRKVIVFDYKHLAPEYVSASALVLVALGITYMLVKKSD
ncbi:MAG: phosphate-starvation-inducible PsiE family protein [Candidatus Nitrotoga sp.]|nr:phosphate-starvation-inducible PsiE family protein [Candidatus Nitrotoga sp.]MDO9446711.1 phosphate-starvation-inducible PsiE family protein [Candidatus Nitrotoga sp.]MDP3497273.1 phosphate-starvation-inducible PsiE family protein [Candidatus Nitrotoga sp.]